MTNRNFACLPSKQVLSGFFDDRKSETKVLIDSLEGIYTYTEG